MVDTLSMDYMQSADSEVLLSIKTLEALREHADWLTLNWGESKSLRYLNLVEQAGKYILPLHEEEMICKYQGPALSRTNVPNMQAQWLDILKEMETLIPKAPQDKENYTKDIVNRINWGKVNPQREPVELSKEFLLYATASLGIQEEIIRLYLNLNSTRLERIKALDEEIMDNNFVGADEAMEEYKHYIGGLRIEELGLERGEHLGMKILLNGLANGDECFLKLLTAPKAPIMDAGCLEEEDRQLFCKQMNKAYYLEVLKNKRSEAEKRPKRSGDEEGA